MQLSQNFIATRRLRILMTEWPAREWRLRPNAKAHKEKKFPARRGGKKKQKGKQFEGGSTLLVGKDHKVKETV